MKFFPTLTLVITSLYLAGCDAPSIQGNAFVVKGDGDVKPAAGRTVYLIPEQSVESLLSRAIEEVTPNAIETYKATIKPMCPSAQETVAALIVANESNLQDLKSRESISESGCLGLQDEAAQLANEVQSVKSPYFEKITSYESELKRLEAQRNVSINNNAEKIKAQQINNVVLSFSLHYMGRGSYNIKLKNNTDYCVKAKVEGEVFSKGIKIGSVKMPSNASRVEDKHGFSMDCVILPHSKPPSGNLVMPNFHAGRVKYDPELKLFAEKHDLPLKDGFFVPDKIVITDAVFGYKPVREEIGKRIVYTSKDVSFYDIASRKKYSENASIAKIKTAIAKEKADFESTSVYNKYVLAKTQADSCITDQAALEEASNHQTVLDDIATEMGNCLNGRINTQTLYQSLVNLASIADTPKPTDINALLNTAALQQVFEIMAGESIRKTDTTINGLFIFKEVPKGEYLLYSEYKDSFVDGFWLTPITVKEDAQYDLNNNNLNDGSLEYYLISSMQKSSR